MYQCTYDQLLTVILLHSSIEQFYQNFQYILKSSSTFCTHCAQCVLYAYSDHTLKHITQTCSKWMYMQSIEQYRPQSRVRSQLLSCTHSEYPNIEQMLHSTHLLSRRFSALYPVISLSIEEMVQFVCCWYLGRKQQQKKLFLFSLQTHLDVQSPRLFSISLALASNNFFFVKKSFFSMIFFLI